MFILALFATLTVGLLLIMKLALPSSPFARGAADRAVANSRTETRAAKVVIELEANRCRQMAFDNDTGRMIEVNEPCEQKVILDDKGVPVPAGTARRLNEISKSFSR
jgi:hypothetical protein